MSSKGKYENELRSIWETYCFSNTLGQLKDFIYNHIDDLTWDDWNYIMINFQLGKSTTREFKDYFDLDFMYEWAMQDFIDTDKDFMRQFRKEFRWYEK